MNISAHTNHEKHSNLKRFILSLISTIILILSNNINYLLIFLIIVNYYYLIFDPKNLRYAVLILYLTENNKTALVIPNAIHY